MMKADKGGVSLDHDTKEKVTKWTEPNGNKCFHFSERQLFEHTWIIILVALLLIAVTGSEYLLNSSFYTLTPNFILFFFAFLWWMTIPLRANEAVIEETVHELMDGMARMKHAPPSGRFTASTVPSCASTMDFTMAKPNPVPPVLRARDVSAR